MVTQRLARSRPSKRLFRPFLGVKAGTNAIEASGRWEARKALPRIVGLGENVHFADSPREFLDNRTLLGHLLVAVVRFLAVDSHKAAFCVFGNHHGGEARQALLRWM